MILFFIGLGNKEAVKIMKGAEKSRLDCSPVFTFR